MRHPTEGHAAMLALAVTIVVWAYTWIVTKQAMRYAGPFDFVALRYAGGALFLVLLMIVRRQSLRPPPIGPTLAVGLCQTTAFPALSQLALVSGGAGRVSLLAYTMPFWVVLLAWWLLRERPGKRQWLALGLAAVGLICVMKPWQGTGSLESTVLAVVSGVAWAFAVIFTKRMFERHSPSMLAFTMWQMVIGALVLGVLALLIPSRPIDWSPAFIYELAYSVIFATSLGWFLWAFIVKALPASVAGLSSLGVPIGAVLMAWLLLGERPGAIESGGMILICVGLLVISGFRIGSRRSSSPAGNAKR